MVNILNTLISTFSQCFELSKMYYFPYYGNGDAIETTLNSIKLLLRLEIQFSKNKVKELSTYPVGIFQA